MEAGSVASLIKRSTDEAMKILQRIQTVLGWRSNRRLESENVSHSPEGHQTRFEGGPLWMACGSEGAHPRALGHNE